MLLEADVDRGTGCSQEDFALGPGLFLLRHSCTTMSDFRIFRHGCHFTSLFLTSTSVPPLSLSPF